MKWFEGKIPDAIQLAKQNGTLFIIYLYGTDELSQKMNATWDSPQVTECLHDNGAVAIRIEKSSEECKFFSQIYPVIVFPSTYCIGEGGVPLEVIGGHIEPNEFVNKMKQVQQMHAAQKASASPPTLNTGQQSTTGAQGQTTAELGETSMDETSEGGASASIPLEERVERAKELLEKKKAEKARQEFEKRREEEIQRRKLGQDLQKLKQNQQEMQMKELKEQMQKEKEEERKAREKIKEQIAKDREDRNARFQKEKQVREKAVEEKKKEQLLEQQKLAAEEEARKSETARIQIRFPDGSSVTQTFPSTDPLQTLHDFVSQRLGGSVSMSTTFPKRKFTEEDMCKTFADLQLAPTAVIIALPGRAGAARQASSSSVQSAGVLYLLLSPLIFLWNFLYSLLFGGGNTGAQQQQTQSSQQTTSSQQSTRERPTTAHQRRNPAATRTDGNVRRLADMKDDDGDDLTTYNGNSTQQM